jgi:hypothetical protein
MSTKRKPYARKPDAVRPPPSEPAHVALAKELSACRVDVLAERATKERIAALLERATRMLVAPSSSSGGADTVWYIKGAT